MMKKYRITFSMGPESDRFVTADIDAISSDDAFHVAYGMRPAKIYKNVTVEEIPDGPANIGLCFDSVDHAFQKTFSGYLVIHAENESAAREYYNRHFRGKRYWFHAGEICEDGKCEYGKVRYTYFAACPGYDADATKEG